MAPKKAPKKTKKQIEEEKRKSTTRCNKTVQALLKKNGSRWRRSKRSWLRRRLSAKEYLQRKDVSRMKSGEQRRPNGWKKSSRWSTIDTSR